MSSESDAAVKNNETNQPLKSLGKYQIERKLGQGGMGTVYLATHTDLKKLVALKVLPRDKAKNPILVRRFKAEAQAAAQLEHPNIVAVYDTGEADGYLFIAMEFVDGIDLFEQVKRRGVIPVKRSIEIIKQVALALQHAFEHNIVHRDIKPSNLLLKHDGTVKVTDLGLARSIDDTLETNITRAGTTVGTVDYMAPEQARSSKSADVRSDIYSLGCTWYQMLTGEPPFSDGSVTNKLHAHATKPLPDPRELNENIPEGLFAVLQRMTAKKPDDRYQTPAELLDDLATSKLTKAAFSNEIFSDLSDYDMDAVQKFNGQADADADLEDDEDEPVERPPRRKKRPIDDQPADEASTKPARRKTQSRVEEELDEPDDNDVRQKSPSKSPDVRPGSISSSPKPRTRALSKSQVEEDDDEETVRGESKRTRPESDPDDPDELTSSRRKRQTTPDSENDHPVSKNGKKPTGQTVSDKPTAKHAPKSLPPKRQPTTTDEDKASPLNLDSLKYLGIAAGVVAAIGGLGWLIFLWSAQVDTRGNPFAQQPDLPAETVAVVAPVPKPVEATNDAENGNSITLIDPPKATMPERSTIIEYNITKQPLPSWATPDTAEPRDMPLFSVGPGATSESHFANFDEALRAADKAGGVVRLLGNGPFLLSKVELNNAKRVVITAATPQDQPLIIVSPSEPGTVAGLTVNNGQLDLRGLHFVFDRSPQNGPTPNSMLTVTDGQLYVRKCSFTATGDGTVPATAMTFLSKQDSLNVPVIPPDVLFDHVTVRGSGLTAIKVDRTTADVVIQDSLLVTGDAPAIEISGTMNPGLAELAESKPRRIVRVLRSTLSGRKQILELGAANTPKPPTTAFFFQDSICSAEGAGNTAVLLSAIRWPSVTSPANGWLTNLNWTSQSSLYIGFERLIDLDKSSYRVANLDAWQRVWGKKFEPGQFQSFVWQESIFADLGSVMPYDFDTSKLPFRDLTTSRGSMPGSTTSQLIVPGFISQSRLAAMGQRPKPPAAISKPADGASTKKVNLTKEDLGAILNKNDWASGTVFEATGSGLQSMLPAKIVGKSLRVIFRQGDGAPLRIQPKGQDYKGKPDIPGLFTIEKGTLDLQSAVLESAQTAKSAATPWLIYSRNASVILRGCQLSGPLQQDLQQHQGLVEWTMTDPPPSAQGMDSNYLSVNDSLLMSTGVGIRFQSATGALYVRNSIVVVRGTAIDLQPVRTGTSLLPIIDLKHVTLSATKAAIRVEAALGTENIVSPMRLFVENCAIVSPLEFKPGEAAESTVLECAGPVIEQKQIEWWGSSNGFAKEVKSLLRQTAGEPVSTAARWHAVWGEANDLRLLTGPKGVHLKNALPNKWPILKASSFALDPTSAGASWAEDGRPVGADVGTIEQLAVAKKGTNEAKPGMTGQSSKQGSPKPIGKKNDPGF